MTFHIELIYLGGIGPASQLLAQLGLSFPDVSKDGNFAPDI
jgi:hypothetical protein